MDTASTSQRGWLVSTYLLVAAAAVLLALIALSPGPNLVSGASAQGQGCQTLTQSITSRHDITCRRAKRVARRARQELGFLPECNGDAARTWKGWRITGHPSGGIGIGTKFKKDQRSFVISGGGTC